MEIEQFIEVTRLWSKKSLKLTYSFKIGILIEKLFSVNIFGRRETIFFQIYMFLYELLKVSQLLNIIIERNSVLYLSCYDIFNLFDYLFFDQYIKLYFQFKLTKFVVFSINIFQIFITIFFFLSFVLTNHKQNNITLKCKFFWNTCILVHSVFRYNLYSLNIFIIQYYYLRENLLCFEKVLFYTDIVSLLFFCSFEGFFSYFFNDISPKNNKISTSVSHPIYNTLITLKFLLYQMIPIVVNAVPRVFLYFPLYVYFGMLYYLYNYKVFIINRVYDNITILTNSFFFSLISIYFSLEIIGRYVKTSGGVAICVYIILGTILSTVCIYFFSENFRLRFYYKRVGKRIDETNLYHELFYIYYLMQKKEVDSRDLIKHMDICNTNPLDDQNQCICYTLFSPKTNISKLNEPIVLFHFQLRNLFILSKFAKKTTIFKLIYFNSFLDNNVLDYNLFNFLISTQFSDLTLYSGQLIIRTWDKYMNVFNNVYFKEKEKEKMAISSKFVYDILRYEILFNDFMKKVKKCSNLTKEFWKNFIITPKDMNMFFGTGMKIAETTIQITMTFVKMQFIFKNKLILLKIYSSFIYHILNDLQSAETYLSIMREYMPTSSTASSYLDNEYGILIISGQKKDLFKIISVNHYFQHLIGESRVKNNDFHRYLPFPLCIFHHNFILNRINFMSANKEIIFQILNDAGDLIFGRAHVIPMMTIKGNINFLVLTYLKNEHTSDSNMTVMCDLEGSIFAVTKRFREEFNIEFVNTPKRNYLLFDQYKNYPFGNTLVNERKIDTILANNEVFHVFPKLFDILPVTRRIFNKSKENTKEKDVLNETLMGKSIEKFNKIFNEVSGNVGRRRGKNEASNKENENQFAFENRLTKERYELKFTKKGFLNDIFFYWWIEIKKFENFRSRIYFDSYIDLPKLGTNIHNNIESKENSSNYCSSNITNNIRNNAFKSNKFLYNYQDVDTTFSSSPKIVKRIFFYIFAILACLLSLSIIQFTYQISEVNTQLNCYDTLDKILNLRYFMILSIINVQRIVNIRSEIESNKIYFFKDKLKFSLSVLEEDLASLKKIIYSINLRDLTDYKETYNLINYKKINLTFLGKRNFTRISQEYTILNALDIYLSQIHSLKNSSSRITSDTIVLVNYQEKAELSDTQILYDFVFYNFFSNLYSILSSLIEAIIKDTKNEIESYNYKFTILINFLLFIYLVILSIIVLIICRIYKIQHFIMKNYQKLSLEFKVKSLNRASNIINNTFNHIPNSNTSPHSKHKRKSLFHKNKVDEIKENSEETKEVTHTDQNLSSKFGTKELDNNSQITLLKKDDNNDEKPIVNNFTILNKNINRQINLKSVSYQDDSWRTKNDYYLKLFLLCVGVLVSFSYILLFQLFFHPYKTSSVESINNYKILVHYKAENNFMLINNFDYTIINNRSSELDNKHEFENKNSFIKYEKMFNFLIYNDKFFFYKELQDKLLQYYSKDCCKYFYSNNVSFFNVSSKDCYSTNLKEGLGIFMIEFRNQIRNLYNSFISRPNKSISDLTRYFSLDDNNLVFYSLLVMYYLRVFYNDVFSAMKVAFIKLSDYLSLMNYMVFFIFLVHFLACLIYIVVKLLRNIFLFFEKMKILISILPKNLLKDGKIRSFLKDYY